MKTPQFRVIPGTTGGLVLSGNDKLRAWLIAQLKLAPENERPKTRLLREALLKELEAPRCAPRDVDLDACVEE